MASQPGSQSSPGGPLLLELAKYSYASVPMNSVAPVPWIHMSNDNSLLACFETRRSANVHGTVEETSVFKVLKDPEVMEELDLNALGREANQAIESSNNAFQHSRDHNVAVIIRAPVIAIKYPRNEREVRRLQIRFRSHESFYDAMKIFSRAGVPTVEAGTFPAQRPQTAASTSSSAITTNADSVSARPETAVRLSRSSASTDTFPETTLNNLVLMPPPPSLLTSREQVKNTSPYFTRAVACGRPLIVDSAGAQHAESKMINCEALGRVLSDCRTNCSPLDSDTISHSVSANSALNQRTNSAIDLCIPRPSTAPEHHSQHLTQLLPPKRELPFEYKKDNSCRAPLRELRNGKRYSAEPSLNEKCCPTVTTSAANENGANAEEVTSSSKRLKRAPTKSTLKVSKSKKHKGVTPSDLQASSTAASPMSIFVPIIDDTSTRDTSKIDLRLNSVNETQVCQDQATPSLTGIAIADNTAVLGKMQDVHVSAARDTEETPADLPSCNSNAIQQCSLNSAAHVAGAAAASSGRQSIMNKPWLGPRSILPSGVVGHPSNPALPETESTKGSHCSPTKDRHPDTAEFGKTFEQLLQCIGSTGASDQTKAWAAQSKEKRSRALQRLFADAYRDPNFHQLCKEVDGEWRSTIVWPGTNTFPETIEEGQETSETNDTR